MPSFTYPSAGVSRNEGKVKALAVTMKVKKESILILWYRGYIVSRGFDDMRESLD